MHRETRAEPSRNQSRELQTDGEVVRLVGVGRDAHATATSAATSSVGLEKPVKPVVGLPTASLVGALM